MTDCMCRGCNAGSGASMHYIPKDPQTRQKWVEFIYKHRPAPKCRNLDRIRICSAHFTEESFTNYRQKMMGFGKRLILKPNAVPTLAVESAFPAAPGRIRREKLDEAMAEIRLCPLCQRHQKDSETLSIHLTKKHSVHPACLENLLINAPYVNRSSGVVSVTISQNSNDTSQEKPSENVKSPVIAVQLDRSSQESGTLDKSGAGNSASGYDNPEASVQEDASNTKNNAAPDSSFNHPFKCHACLDFFTHKSALSVHHNSATHIQKTITGTGNDCDSSTAILAYPYVSTKPYQCDVCHVSYFYSFGLESHLKSVLHQSRTRKAENAAANSKTNTETRIVMANLVGTPVANATQLAPAKTCNCSTQAEKVQLQPCSSLHPAPVGTAQAVPTVLPVLTLANSVPHTIVPSVIPLSGTSTAQLIPQPQILMPLIVNRLQTQSATPDVSQQILQQAVPVFDPCSARKFKGLGSGDSQSQSAATGISGASLVPLETNTTVDGLGVKVKLEIKSEPCDQEVWQMTPSNEDAMSQVSLKQEQNSTWDGIEETVLCGDKQQSKAKEVTSGLNSKRQRFDVNQASTNQNCHDYLALKPSCTQPCSRLSPEPSELTEFQSQVLWAFIESRNEADSKILPREDCEALGKEVGLTEDEVRKWLIDTYRTKDKHQAAVQSLYERLGNTEDDEDTLMIDESGGTVLRSTTDFLSDEEEGADEQTTVDKKRKSGLD